jgi:hypothetical protein
MRGGECRCEGWFTRGGREEERGVVGSVIGKKVREGAGGGGGVEGGGG